MFNTLTTVKEFYIQVPFILQCLFQSFDLNYKDCVQRKMKSMF